jgi:hypothetical protein
MSCHSREGGSPGGMNLNKANFVRGWNTNDTSSCEWGRIRNLYLDKSLCLTINLKNQFFWETCRFICKRSTLSAVSYF